MSSTQIERNYSSHQSAHPKRWMAIVLFIAAASIFARLYLLIQFPDRLFNVDDVATIIVLTSVVANIVFLAGIVGIWYFKKEAIYALIGLTFLNMLLYFIVGAIDLPIFLIASGVGMSLLYLFGVYGIERIVTPRGIIMITVLFVLTIGMQFYDFETFDHIFRFVTPTLWIFILVVAPNIDKFELSPSRKNQLDLA